jgi:hypothetical protein
MTLSEYIKLKSSVGNEEIISLSRYLALTAFLSVPNQDYPDQIMESGEVFKYRPSRFATPINGIDFDFIFEREIDKKNIHRSVKTEILFADRLKYRVQKMVADSDCLPFEADDGMFILAAEFVDYLDRKIHVLRATNEEEENAADVPEKKIFTPAMEDFDRLFKTKKDMKFILRAMRELDITDRTNKSILKTKQKAVLAGFVKALRESEKKIVSPKIPEYKMMNIFQFRIGLAFTKLKAYSKIGKQAERKAAYYFNEHYS